MSALPEPSAAVGPEPSAGSRPPSHGIGGDRLRLAPGTPGRERAGIALGILLEAIGLTIWMAAGGPHIAPLWQVTVPTMFTGLALIVAGVVRREARIRETHGARRRERLAAVLAIADRLTRSFDRAEILSTLVTETNRTLAADGTTIRVLRDGLLEVAASAGLSDEVAARLPAFRADEGWFGEIARTGRPWFSEDVESDPVIAARYRGYEPGHRFSSHVVVPLSTDGRVIGALSCATVAGRRWTADDVEFLMAVAASASMALHNADLFERTQARAAQLEVLRAASARMSRENSVESVGRAIVEETRRIIDYHNARVYLLEDGGELVPIAFEGLVGAYEKVDFDLLRTRVGVGFTGWVAGEGRPLLVDDANLDPRGSTIPGTDEVDESMLVVPMRYDERTTGVITLSKLGLRQFDADDLRLLTILADQAATAMETTRLLARTQALADELRRLLDMGSDLSRTLDPRAVADLIARHVGAAIGVDGATISYWDRGADRLLTWGCWPVARIEMVEPAYDLAARPATRRVLEEQAVVVLDGESAPIARGERPLPEPDGTRTVVMLPLVAKGQSIGLVELAARAAVELSPSQLELARTMANEAAMALENAKLYEDARKLADHDPLTGFHNHRYLHERLGEEIVRAGRSRRPLGLLMIDLDDFKLVNDTFGHLFGDRVLAWTAERIRSTLRQSDVPARYGGDEFAVILPDTDRDAAEAVANRIVEAFRTEAFQGEARGPVPVGVSVGIAVHPDDARTAPELIAAADGALYAVKRAGGRGAVHAETVARPEVAGPRRIRATTDARAGAQYEGTGRA